MRMYALCLIFAAVLPAAAQTRRITRPAAAGLENEFKSILNSEAGAAWIGYSVPRVPGQGRSNCCCLSGKLDLESGELDVLFRIDAHKVEKIRVAGDNCEIDAGNLPLYWLTGVRPADSLALLARYASEDAALADGAIAAVALHADPGADRLLEGFTEPSRPERMREKTVFWLGASRGAAGYRTLAKLVKADPSDRIREKAVFALSVSKEPGALDSMIDTARTDPSAHVRKQALFWLAQKAAAKAAQEIRNAVENDPDTDVKRHAVFALSQLPHGDGVPLLIDVARTNRNREVRKQAMFWLGQSTDPRALEFIEQVLGK